MLPDPLFDILRIYATLQSPKLILTPDVPFESAHAFLLDHVLLNHHFGEYPPSKQYQLTFWKWAIGWLERLASDEDELDERFYTHHVELMHGSTSKKNVGLSRPAASYLTYLWKSDRPPNIPVYPGHANVTLVESRTTIEGGTTGLRTWSASLILAQFILAHPELIRSQRVMELGCGVGLLGTIAASIQLDTLSAEPPSLWLTDVNEYVLQRCEVNLRLPCNPSHSHPDLNIHALDWSDAVDSSRKKKLYAFLNTKIRPTVILGADLVYEPSIIPLLVAILDVTLAPCATRPRPVAYIALTLRNGDTMSEFLRRARDVLLVEEVEAVPVVKNVFTAAAELGQEASEQVVKIFKIVHLTSMEHNVMNEEEM